MKLTYKQALDWIHSRLPFGSRPGLTRINALLERLDNPQNKIKTIHIAGTNGKGSTVTFLRCLLESQGLIVGTFTSPYITRFNERISINGPIPDEELVELVESIQEIVEEMDQDPELAGATEFEIVTAMMFECFYQQAVDVAIVEVGLGGKLDCTNVITPLISGITTIGLDHQDILGETIADIALQKAGIIKSDRPVVTGNIGVEALEVITAEAKRLGSPIKKMLEDYQISATISLGLAGEKFTFTNDKLFLPDLEIPLVGRHQVDNASLALEMYSELAEILDFTLDDSNQVQEALAKAQWPGRMEKVWSEPLVIIDGAHNELAVRVLVENLKREVKQRKIHLIFAAINTKDVGKMLKELTSLPDYQLYLTTFDYPKAYQIAEYPTESLNDYHLMPDWKQGIKKLQTELSPDDILIVTGSLYFISQVREYFLGGSDE